MTVKITICNKFHFDSYDIIVIGGVDLWKAVGIAANKSKGKWAGKVDLGHASLHYIKCDFDTGEISGELT